MCHHCGLLKKFNNICKACNSNDIAFIGEGTEKIEEIIKEEFSESNIIRIDSDSTKKRVKRKKFLMILKIINTIF